MNANVAAKGVSFFTPEQNPPAGTAAPSQPDDKPIPLLFQPLTIRGLTVQNRIFVSPMCQYSAKDGKITPWHFAHLGGIFTRGPGLTFTEATSVVPEGRITPEDAGIWLDEHAALWAPIVEFAHSQNQKIAMQLGHAGRKASITAPWLPGPKLATEELGGWADNVYAASPLRFNDDYPLPKEMSRERIKEVVDAFRKAAERAVKVGFDALEVHGGHGYLLFGFMSPTSNHRTDEYGGSFENRIRFALEVIDAIRSVMPPGMPLFYRISGSECVEQTLPDITSWRSEDTVRIAPILAAHGVDVLDVSAGGNNNKQKIIPGPAYQSPLAHAVRRTNPGLLVATVGGITDGHTAQGVLEDGLADVVLCGRAFQQNPGLVLRYAQDLGVDIHLAHQIQWGYKMGRTRRGKAN
ncbi:FMN-linked oxidoreductase [Desarmillaria tabescens]|uniref:FMN-linked oxidoreductase n=1 Tax=Armillaria tabescens TaxID=1929756 RepID=A0AA39J5F9_ARMTA|nr:FMN-linked oxidoreductase [Desarmillaria tabescens]KAK0436476.1 FMN-linked oxidoreductase [Desarmillaria tabescens]